MKDIKILEQELTNGKKIAIFCYVGDGDPEKHLNKAIKVYTDDAKNYNEFIDMNMDNPWVRIICPPICSESFKTFQNQKINKPTKKQSKFIALD